MTAESSSSAAPRRQASVSVVIPVRDGERFIGECVRSVLTQTVRPAEILVVDDGSTDRTEEMVSSFGGPVRYIQTAAAGVSAARNRGLDEAEGDVIALLDVDDVWLPHKLEGQLAALGRAKAAAGGCSGYVVTDEALRPRRVVRPPSNGAMAVQRALLVEGPGVGFSFTGLVTRAAVERVGRFDPRLSTSADLDYAWRLTQECAFLAVPEPLALHRMHAPVQMHRDTSRLGSDMAIVLETAETNGLAPPLARRGRANLSRYVAVRHWIERPGVTTLGRVVQAAPHCPSGAGRMAIEGVTRRPVRRRAARSFSHSVPVGQPAPQPERLGAA